jgi:single-strand DNA-binding protein
MKLLGLARIGNDPELRYTSGNMAVLQLSLAYNHGKEKKTQWVSSTLFGKRAESLVNFLQKGQLIYVELSDIHVDTFKGKDGVDRVSLKGMVQDIEFTGKTGAEKTETATEPQRAGKTVDIANLEDDMPF